MVSRSIEVEKVYIVDVAGLSAPVNMAVIVVSMVNFTLLLNLATGLTSASDLRIVMSRL